MTTTDTLDRQSFPASEHAFFRAPVLLWGTTEAVLVDGGFTLADGRALTEAIEANVSKKLRPGGRNSATTGRRRWTTWSCRRRSPTPR